MRSSAKHPLVMREMKSIESMRRDNNFISANNAIGKKLGELAGKLIQEQMTPAQARVELLREVNLWTSIAGPEAVANALGSLKHLMPK